MKFKIVVCKLVEFGEIEICRLGSIYQINGVFAKNKSYVAYIKNYVFDSVESDVGKVDNAVPSIFSFFHNVFTKASYTGS